MNHWKKSTLRICGKLALKHSITNELCVFGKYGEIYQQDSGTITVLINNGQILNKHLKHLLPEKTKYKQDDEMQITVPEAEFDKWSKIIRRGNTVSQLKIANKI